MALRVRADGLFGEPHQACGACGSRLIPYVPRCMRCGAVRPRKLHEDPPLLELGPTGGGLRLGHLTDLHVGKAGSNPSRLECFRWWLEEFKKAGVDAVAVSGDLVENGGDRRSLRQVRETLERSAIAWCAVPGNHDIPQGDEPNNMGLEFGIYPRVESRGGIEFILLDSNAGIQLEERGLFDRLVPSARRAFGLCVTGGRVGRPQLETASKLLGTERTQPRVLVLHHHLAYQKAELLGGILPEDVASTMEVLQDAAAVTTWAVDHGVKLVLHGHKHVMMRAGVHHGGVVVLNGGSSTSGPPYRARLVDLLPDGERRVIEVEMLR